MKLVRKFGGGFRRVRTKAQQIRAIHFEKRACFGGGRTHEGRVGENLACLMRVGAVVHHHDRIRRCFKNGFSADRLVARKRSGNVFPAGKGDHGVGRRRAGRPP